MEAFYGILIPFLGTSLGAACVFFLKKTLSDAVQRALTGFAAGVMVAAQAAADELRADGDGFRRHFRPRGLRVPDGGHPAAGK